MVAELELVLASANPDKAAEISAILGLVPGVVIGLGRALLRAVEAKRREQDHLADVRLPGKQHHETVDPDADTARRRHPVLEGAQEILVE